jgi:alpha-L-rhamnosidase
MIEAGAETFFEAWNPDEPRSSPYGDLHANSYVWRIQVMLLAQHR